MLLRELIIENFADGKHPEDKGDSARHGIPKHASISSLRNIAKQGGRKGQLAHWQANMRSGRAKANESADQNRQVDFMDMMEKFLPICMKELDLKVLPKFKLVKTVNDDHQPTFGKFENEEVLITIGLANRHPLDVLRTLAHELVHFKQDTKHMLNDKSGETGSPEENQAHAVAGVIMRHFNKAHRDYFHTKPIIGETATAGATSAGNVSVGAIYKNVKAKSLKNKNGTVKNALDTSANLLTGGSIKR